MDDEQIDEISGERVPVQYAAIVRRTALAIIGGIRDPLYPIREFMYEHGEWMMPSEKDGDIEEESEIKSKKKRKKKDGLDNETMDFDADFNEEDEIDNVMDNDEFEKQFRHDD